MITYFISRYSGEGFTTQRANHEPPHLPSFRPTLSQLHPDYDVSTGSGTSSQLYLCNPSCARLIEQKLETKG